MSVLRVFILLTFFSTGAIAGTSTEYRQEKSISAATEIGSSVYPHPTAGFSLGYFATPNLRLEATYTKGEIDFFDEMSSKLYSARLKYFIGNSFYVNFGAAYRELDLVINEWLFSDRRLERSVHHTGAEISMGNSWQFPGFTIGCDWAGYFLPINKTKDSRQESGSLISLFGGEREVDEDDEDFATEKRWNSYAKRGTWQAVRLNIGWSF